MLRIAAGWAGIAGAIRRPNGPKQCHGDTWSSWNREIILIVSGVQFAPKGDSGDAINLGARQYRYILNRIIYGLKGAKGFRIHTLGSNDINVTNNGIVAI